MFNIYSIFAIFVVACCRWFTFCAASVLNAVRSQRCWHNIHCWFNWIFHLFRFLYATVSTTSLLAINRKSEKHWLNRKKVKSYIIEFSSGFVYDLEKLNHISIHIGFYVNFEHIFWLKLMSHSLKWC